MSTRALAVLEIVRHEGLDCHDLVPLRSTNNTVVEQRGEGLVFERMHSVTPSLTRATGRATRCTVRRNG